MNHPEMKKSGATGSIDENSPKNNTSVSSATSYQKLLLAFFAGVLVTITYGQTASSTWSFFRSNSDSQGHLRIDRDSQKVSQNQEQVTLENQNMAEQETRVSPSPESYVISGGKPTVRVQLSESKNSVAPESVSPSTSTESRKELIDTPSPSLKAAISPTTTTPLTTPVSPSSKAVVAPPKITASDVKFWYSSGPFKSKCGSFISKVKVAAIDGRDLYFDVGCDPSGMYYCCSGSWCGNTAAHCSGRDYRKPGVYKSELFALNTALGPLAKKYKLTGLEWREDKLCGASSGKDVRIYRSASAAASVSFPGCNPDSKAAYWCHNGICGIEPEDRKKGIDYRLAKSWVKERKPVSHDAHMDEHVKLYKNKRYKFEDVKVPDGVVREGFDEHQSIKSPHWYHITMGNRRSEGEALEKELQRIGVPAADITFIEAVTPAMIRQARLVVPGSGTAKERGCLLAHLRMMKHAWDSGYPVAIVVEADVSTRLVGMWNRPVEMSEEGKARRHKENSGLTLADVLEGLEKHDREENTKWEICQVCITCGSVGDCKKYSKEMLNALYEGKTVIHRHPSKHYTAWGTVSYMVSRAGMARILDRVWPGGKDGRAFADLQPGARFGTSGGIQADVVLYKTTRPEATFLSARPLLDSKAIKSDVHPQHLSTHIMSKYLLESALYIDGGSLYEHIYGVPALEAEEIREEEEERKRN